MRESGTELATSVSHGVLRASHSLGNAAAVAGLLACKVVGAAFRAVPVPGSPFWGWPRAAEVVPVPHDPAATLLLAKLRNVSACKNTVLQFVPWWASLIAFSSYRLRTVNPASISHFIGIFSTFGRRLEAYIWMRQLVLWAAKSAAHKRKGSRCSTTGEALLPAGKVQHSTLAAVPVACKKMAPFRPIFLRLQSYCSDMQELF